MRLVVILGCMVPCRGPPGPVPVSKRRLCTALLPCCHRRYGDDYGYGGRIDELYAREIADRLNGSHYMDYTGGVCDGCA